MLEKNQIVSLTTAEMQLHFEVKKYFEEEKKTAQKFHGSGNLNENTEGGKIVRIMLPWKNVNSFVHSLAKKNYAPVYPVQKGKFSIEKNTMGYQTVLISKKYMFIEGSFGSPSLHCNPLQGHYRVELLTGRSL